MKNYCNNYHKPGKTALLFTAGLILLMPPLLIIDKFRLFLFLCFMQICLLITVFYEPLVYLAAHIATLFVLIYRVAFRAAHINN